MAPGVAALVGVGTVVAASAIKRDRRWLVAVFALVGVTVWVQLQIAGRAPDFYGWVRPLTVAAALGGGALVALLAVRRRPVMQGLAVAVGGLLLLPAAWSISAAENASLNATLPQAGPQQGASGATFGSAAFDDGTALLAAWLTSQDDGRTRWQLVVANSQGGSRLIAEYELSVMSLGGFLGRDNTITAAGFADVATSGDVRFVLVGQAGGRGGGAPGRALPGNDGSARGLAGAAPGNVVGSPAPRASAVVSAVQGACTSVRDPALPTTYQGSLYDCAGKADAIRAAAR